MFDVLPGTGVIAVNKMSKLPVFLYLNGEVVQVGKKIKVIFMEIVDQSSAGIWGKWGATLHRLSCLLLLLLLSCFSRVRLCAIP